MPDHLRWLWTCRHGSEAVLRRELGLLGPPPDSLGTPCPGLVMASGDLPAAPTPEALARLDPVWALQVMPAACELRGASIRALAEAAARYLQPRIDGVDGPWDLHTLVPGQLKGTPKPQMAHRAALIGQEAVAVLARTRRRACKLRVAGTPAPVALAQLLLLEPGWAFVSWSPCLVHAVGGRWPSRLPAGLEPVPDDPTAPSSAFRKLEEALSCMERWPRPGQRVVDLGASPGGWTRVMRRHGAQVTAVDRSVLAPEIMADPEVTFVQGDAFAYLPAAPADWLVSDIIAYPERVSEVLHTWCGGRLAETMVVQMKFKGEPDLQAIAAALAIARSHGYHGRARHFFNDKNEATLMLRTASR